MLDGFNREIDYARISLTNLCNLKCSYCGDCPEDENTLPLEFYRNIIDVLVKIGVNKIRFTGGEPLLNKNIVELIKYANTKNKFIDICLTTNGLLLDKYLEDFIKNGLTRINFSLDTVNKDIYKKITGNNNLDKVIENIKLAKAKGLIVKVNAVLLKGISDINIYEFLQFGYENGVQIRFIELMPMGSNIDYYNKYYLSSDEILKKIKCEKVCSTSKDVSSYYVFEEKYEFGIISAISNHFCNRCNRIRITSNGALRLCLHSDMEIDLVNVNENSDLLYKTIMDSISLKPEKHLINENSFVKSDMVNIGG